MDKLCVITTSMNYGRYIEDCIQSVIGQKASFPFEINHLIMDGGSTDETAEILEKYSDKLHCYINKGEGQTEALNHAMRIIERKFPETEYVGWLNADDCYLPSWLESSLSTHKRESPEVAATCANYNQIRILEHPTGGVGFIEAKVTFQDQRPYVDFKGLLESNNVCQPTICIKLSAFVDVKERDGHYFNPKIDYCQDYELWLRFLLHGYKICRIRDYLAILRQHPLTLSNTHRERQAVEVINLQAFMRSESLRR